LSLQGTILFAECELVKGVLLLLPSLLQSLEVVFLHIFNGSISFLLFGFIVFFPFFLEFLEVGCLLLLQIKNLLLVSLIKLLDLTQKFNLS